jgi:hypothetical protein
LCARLVVATVATVARNNRDTEVAVARQPSETGSAEESDVPLEELEIDAEADDLDDDVDDDADASERSAASDALWTDVRVQPVEIALPSGIGFTLRAYRLSTEVREPELGDRDDDFPLRGVADDVELDEADLPAIDEDELTAQALAAGQDGEPKADVDAGDEADAKEDDGDSATNRAAAPVKDVDEVDAATDVDPAEADADADAEEEESTEPEEVPVFLAERGKLLLFRSAEGLVDYVRGTHDHELAQLDSWAELRERIEAEDIVPLDEDRYELDLVVENLRGGHDAVDPELIIQAGELSRDIGYALRLQAVINALAPGSPLDDLDEGLRAVETGGFRSFFARRRVRKIEAQTTAALGWRTVIGKISAVVDWRN